MVHFQRAAKLTTIKKSLNLHHKCLLFVEIKSIFASIFDVFCSRHSYQIFGGTCCPVTVLRIKKYSLLRQIKRWDFYQVIH